MYINQAELTLPSKDLYADTTSRNLLKKLILKIVKLLKAQESSDTTGAGGGRAKILRNTNIENQVEDIVNFELALSLKARKYKDIRFSTN